MTESVREARKRRGFQKELAAKGGWYHSFRLPGGTLIEGYNDLEYLERRWASFPIPTGLRGRRVLDIGTWDGYFAFTAEQRGAEVTAVDYVEQPNFLWLHRRLGSRVDYRILDVYELPQAGLGAFDIVFFLGILYHLKHPLLALEIVCAHTRETAVVESFVIDGDTWEQHRDDLPVMEFYETDELGGQLDNWVGPTVGCLLALCRAAGFARVELIRVSGSDAMVACHRRWEPVPERPAAAPPELVAVDNNITGGINFATRKDDYVSAWFRADRIALAREDVRFEIDGLGVAALWAGRYEGGWTANFRLPPGLAPGWREARLRFADSAFSASHRIAVDLPLHVERLEVGRVCDGFTWQDGEAATHLTCWVQGLPENADRANVRLMLEDARLKLDYVGPMDTNGWRQINAFVPESLPRGRATLIVSCAGVPAAPAQVLLK